MRPVLILSLFVLAACGPSAGVKRAQTLLDRGDYRGAATAADEEIGRASCRERV